MKKWITILTLAVILAWSCSEVYADSNINIVDGQSSMGKLGIYFNTGTSKKVKLIISKGSEKYTYNLQNLDQMVYFPLQMGNGQYTVKVYENTQGNKYRALTGKSINVKITDPKSVYLQSVQEIEWNEHKKAIKNSQKLIEQRENELGHKLSPEETTQVIYEYIIEKIVYDYSKINRLSSTYLPDIDETYVTEKGICYDYSSLFAALLRNQGIPTKMAKGYSTYTDVYHAWNEVYVDNKWVIVDSTTDAYLYQNNAKFSFEKEKKDYNKTKEL